jgi:hypothetical protein
VGIKRTAIISMVLVAVAGCRTRLEEPGSPEPGPDSARAQPNDFAVAAPDLAMPQDAAITPVPDQSLPVDLVTPPDAWSVCGITMQCGPKAACWGDVFGLEWNSFCAYACDSSLNDQNGQNPDCPFASSTCVRIAPGNFREFCMSTCAVDGDCRDGYVCQTGICWPEYKCATPKDCHPTDGLVEQCLGDRCAPCPQGICPALDGGA